MSDFDVLNTSVEALSLGLTEGRYTSEGIVTRYVDQIDRHNKRGLGLNAVIDVLSRKNALKLARARDEERRKGRARSRLHGIPILIKEVIGTKESFWGNSGFKTTGGTLALRSRTTHNADVVDTLEELGLIVLGKTNLTAMSSLYGGIPTGWSPRGGQTYSAFVHPNFNPGGSSSGSAVAVSAGFAPVSLGVETMGSIIFPAMRAGLVGFKPSGGQISNKGILGVSKEYDTPGPMGSCVTDVANLFVLLTKKTDSCTTRVDTTNQPVLNVGVARSGFPVALLDELDDECVYTPELTGEAERHFASVIARLKDSCSVQDPADVPDVLRFVYGDDPNKNGPWVSVLYTHLSETINDFLQTYTKGGRIRNLEDLVDWNSKHPSDVSPADSSNPGWMLKAALDTVNAADGSYHTDHLKIADYAKKVDAVFTDRSLDVIIFPGGLTFGDSYVHDVASSGTFPCGTVPIAQLSNGQPYGIFIMGRHGEDLTVLRAMSRVERMMKCRPVPTRLVRIESARRSA